MVRRLSRKMKRPVLFAAFLLLVASAVFAGMIPADDPNFQYVGRINFRDRKAPGISWPGTAIRANFTGTSLKVKLRDDKGKNMFNVFIDGKYGQGHVLACEKGESVYPVATGLDNGSHELLITKRTEGEQGATAFLGLELEDGASLEAPPPRPSLRMEVFGDSISVGLGADLKRGGEHSIAARNNFITYGAITARNLGAEYVCTAKSGIGLLKSWFPTTMPEYYDRLFATSLEGYGPAWDFSLWQPHIVVINVLQNDSWLVKSKRQAAATPDAYVTFVQKIRGHYPDARIICALGSMDASRNKWAGYVREAVKRLNDGGDAHVHLYIFKTRSNKHPNAGHHKAMAEELTAFIKTLGEIEVVAPEER